MINASKIVDGFDGGPCTHAGGAPGLVGELKVIQAERITEQEENDPIKNLRYEATHSN